MDSPTLRLPEGLTPAGFLRDYWQKKPLLLRAALPGFTSPVSPEELAGLACEDGVESRLVLERGGTRPWELRHGPFPEAEFLELPDSHWTLLVQDMEKHVPALHAVLEPFRFVPDWRIDDLMVSYAPEHGSVGPHLDDYDVFLVQALGRRRWQIDTRPDAEDWLPDTELRILRRFRAEQEWVLEPGDVLYLPPRVAHHGVALEPCMTYSVGFRAPSHRELVAGYLDFLLEEVDAEARYADPDLGVQDNPGEIGRAALARFRDLLRQHILLDDGLIESWLGRFLTEPKPGFAAEPEPQPLTAAELREHLRGGGELERNAGSRFAYLGDAAGETALFVDGQEFVLGPEVAWLAPLLCRHRVLGAAHLQRALTQPPARELLLDLVNEGYLVMYDDD